MRINFENILQNVKQFHKSNKKLVLMETYDNQFIEAVFLTIYVKQDNNSMVAFLRYFYDCG